LQLIVVEGLRTSIKHAGLQSFQDLLETADLRPSRCSLAAQRLRQPADDPKQRIDNTNVR